MNPKIFDRIKELAFALHDPDNGHRCFHLTFVVWKNKIINISRNQTKTHPTNLKNRKINQYGDDVTETKFSCSELIAAQQVKKKTNIPFNKIVFVNVRINKNKELSNASPCSSCKSLILFLKPKELFFTNNSGHFEKYTV